MMLLLNSQLIYYSDFIYRYKLFIIEFVLISYGHWLWLVSQKQKQHKAIKKPLRNNELNRQ